MANKDDEGSDVHIEQQTRVPKKSWSTFQHRCGRSHPGVAQTVTETLAPLELGMSTGGAAATTAVGGGDGCCVAVGGCAGAGEGAVAGSGAEAAVGSVALTAVGPVAGEGAASTVESDKALAMRSSSVAVGSSCSNPTQLRTVSLIRVPSAFACGS